MTTPARLLSCCLAGLAAAAVFASCSSAPGNRETDRIATTVAEAISYPRQKSADGLVRAALATSSAQSSTLTVVGAKELEARNIADPLARLVFRIHLEGSLSGFSRTEPITACYEAEFNFYGVIGSPHRTDCPAGATAIVPPPLVPKQRVVIPVGFDAPVP